MASVFGHRVRMKHPAKANSQKEILLRLNIEGSGFSLPSFTGVTAKLNGAKLKYSVPVVDHGSPNEGVLVYSDEEIRVTIQPSMQVPFSAESPREKVPHTPSHHHQFDDTNPTSDTLTITDASAPANSTDVSVDLVAVDPCLGA
jgi:hypothetical protein